GSVYAPGTAGELYLRAPMTIRWASALDRTFGDRCPFCSCRDPRRSRIRFGESGCNRDKAELVERDGPRRIHLQNITLALDASQNVLQFDPVGSNKSLSLREIVGGVRHKENERIVDCRERIPSVIAVLNNVPRLARACSVQLVSNLHNGMGDVSQMF